MRRSQHIFQCVSQDFKLFLFPNPLVMGRGKGVGELAKQHVLLLLKKKVSLMTVHPSLGFLRNPCDKMCGATSGSFYFLSRLNILNSFNLFFTFNFLAFFILCMLNFARSRLSFNMLLNFFSKGPPCGKPCNWLTSTSSEKGFFIINIVFELGSYSIKDFAHLFVGQKTFSYSDE